MRVAALLLDRADMNALSAYIEEMNAETVEAWRCNSLAELMKDLRDYDLVIVVKRTSYMVCGTWLSDIAEPLRKNGQRVMLIRRKINA